jgi:hypothetical protein
VVQSEESLVEPLLASVEEADLFEPVEGEIVFESHEMIS